MRDHPHNDGEHAPGFHRRHRHERQAAPPGERGRHRPHAPDLDSGELRIGTRLRRAQRQRVLRLIWPPARGDRARLRGARPTDSWTCGAALPGNVLGFSGKGIPNVNYEFRPGAKQSRSRARVHVERRDRSPSDVRTFVRRRPPSASPRVSETDKLLIVTLYNEENCRIATLR